LFFFAVSIQNHGPYDAGYMYPDLNRDLDADMPKNYLTTPGITLSIKGDYAVTNYIRGIQDADASLGRLTDYLDGVGRPVVLVFFGDHLPGLGRNFSAYQELGYPIGYDRGFEEKANIFRERYFIWANAEAREMWPGYETLRQETHRMSANYLGVYLMEQIGLDCGAYGRLVNKMRGAYPVYHPLFYGAGGRDEMPLADGAIENDSSGGLIDEYRIAQYYKLFDERIK
jgi:hypothetical protein